jgi:hypothetical protein
VRRALEKGNIGVYAEITVKRALARLRKRGLVRNSRTRPRGYYLPERLTRKRSQRFVPDDSPSVPFPFDSVASR